jgi:alkanesulfonate monooxygenase SsuD/methylene tetrahydromethanopterin reductase-like flavin-dependent oxidoreductase (luciferase family)
MDFHMFMYVTIGRRRELEQGMAGKNPKLYQRMLDEIGEYARFCDAAGYAGIGIPEHHLQVEGFELGQDPGLMAMWMGMQTKRLRINQFGYVLPTHNPLRVAEHAATLDHMLGGRLNVAFVRGYQHRWVEQYAAVPGVKATGPWNAKTRENEVNRELFEECVAIIKKAWAEDTFSYRGKYWQFPPEGSKNPHDHPVYTKYGRGVDPDGTIREVGIAPKPLQQPSIPIYSGFTHSMQTSMFWAREGGKPIVMSRDMKFCELLWRKYRETAETHGRTVAPGEEAAWGGYLVLAETKSQAEQWAEDCLWMWDTWSVPFGQDRPPLLIGDVDTVTRIIEDAARHVKFNEVYMLFGQGLLERDQCLKSLELFAEKVLPRFKDA